LSSSRELASGKLIVDEPADHVVRVKIANPAKRGALDHEILDGIAELMGELDARCVVITGDGPVFSAGYDLGNLEGDEFSTNAEKLVAHPFTAAIEAIERYRFPVVAAINGHAIGGGLELAVACDIRIAARDVKLGMPPAKLGLIYSHTGLKKFIEVCGVANTNELFYVGSYVDADRALQMGLVNQVVERGGLEEKALKMAREIGANAPLSLSGNKTVIRALRDNPGQMPPQLESQLVELRESCFRTEDFQEGVRAFGEKRSPDWQGR
jgi:enoyl-CoA hydratase/carnithine racemase